MLSILNKHALCSYFRSYAGRIPVLGQLLLTAKKNQDFSSICIHLIGIILCLCRRSWFSKRRYTVTCVFHHLCWLYFVKRTQDGAVYCQCCQVLQSRLCTTFPLLTVVRCHRLGTWRHNKSDTQKIQLRIVRLVSFGVVWCSEKERDWCSWSGKCGHLDDLEFESR